MRRAVTTFDSKLQQNIIKKDITLHENVHEKTKEHDYAQYEHGMCENYL